MKSFEFIKLNIAKTMNQPQPNMELYSNTKPNNVARIGISTYVITIRFFIFIPFKSDDQIVY